MILELRILNFENRANTTFQFNRSIFFFRGTTAPKSQDRLKRLLPDGSTGGPCG